MNRRRVIGLLGGSFNPPHLAHQLLCLLALTVRRVDELWLLPCHQHAFEKELAPFDQRLAMCELLAAPFGDRVSVSDLERQLGGVSRTLRLLEHLTEAHADVDWVLVVGSDILEEAPRWLGWDEIQSLATFYVVDRGMAEGARGLTLPDISSGQIRHRLRAGGDVAAWLPGDILDYVLAQGLYQGEG